MTVRVLLVGLVIMHSSSSGSHSVIKQTDRRRGQRARLGVSVTITVAGKLVDALGADLSLGGIRVVASARGVVRWIAATQHGLPTFGVLFTAIEEDGANVVAAFCRSSVS